MGNVPNTLSETNTLGHQQFFARDLQRANLHSYFQWIGPVCGDFIPDVKNYSGRPPAFIRLHLELCQLKSPFPGTSNGTPADIVTASIFRNLSSSLKGTDGCFYLNVKIKGQKAQSTLGVIDPTVAKIFSSLFHANVDLPVRTAKI